jgi:hypothetical protein
LGPDARIGVLTWLVPSGPMTVVSSGVSHGSCVTGRLGLHSQTTFARAVPALASDAQASRIAAAIASRHRCPATKPTPGRFELVAIHAPPTEI